MLGCITVSNGDTMETMQTGDIPYVICGKNGNVLKTAVLTDVAVTTGSPFNLLSLKMIMQKGWTLEGDIKRIPLLISPSNVRPFFEQASVGLTIKAGGVSHS
jgi:hypothetical protein